METVTAIRLEALTDPSLPKHGPGRTGEGTFILTGFKVAAVPKPPADAAAPLRGRFVRLDVPAANRDAFSKADVQVFGGAAERR